MEEVAEENLVPGKEYYMQCIAPDYLPPNKPFKMKGRFEQVIKGSYIPLKMEGFYISNFRRLDDRESRSRIKLTKNWRFYEMKRDKVQTDMENRAYELILLKIVKDENFIPHNIGYIG